MTEFARYVGTATVRRMLDRDWKAAGIEDQKTIEFSPRNGYAVARDQFTDAAWEALASDPGIIFTGERPDPDATHNARVEAAKNRLRARQAGHDVLHAQDEIPGTVVMSGSTPGAKVQGSDATSRPGTAV